MPAASATLIPLTIQTDSVLNTEASATLNTSYCSEWEWVDVEY